MSSLFRRLLFLGLSALGVLLMVLSAQIVGQIAALEEFGLVGFILFTVLMTTHAIRFYSTRLLARNFDLSAYHPMTSMFFVVLVIVGYFRGDDLSTSQFLAAAAITVGALLLTTEESTLGQK